MIFTCCGEGLFFEIGEPHSEGLGESKVFLAHSMRVEGRIFRPLDDTRVGVKFSTTTFPLRGVDGGREDDRFRLWLTEGAFLRPAGESLLSQSHVC